MLVYPRDLIISVCIDCFKMHCEQHDQRYQIYQIRPSPPDIS